MTGKSNNEKEGIGELLRRVMLASVGAAALGVDELEELIRRARERGELTAADAQKSRQPTFVRWQIEGRTAFATGLRFPARCTGCSTAG